MSFLSNLLPFLFLLLLFPSFSISATTCPLNITILRHIGDGTLPPINPTERCHYITEAINLVQSDYLHRTGFFVPPLDTAESCWTSFQKFIDDIQPNFDIRLSCGFQTSWISQGCMNITTKQQFENQVSLPQLQSLQLNCNVSLDNNVPCGICTSKRAEALSSLTGATPGTVADCRSYTAIYSASLSDEFGPTNTGTAKCLFGLDFTSSSSGSSSLNSGLDSMNQSTTLIRFNFDEIKKATRNFSRDNIIGSGGYGNVYKGLLSDGTEVALKRFKNCSVAGDASFKHEVEVIASVRHVNLVALRGYCTATTNLEGHQRIIVTDLMENGSLYDHLFGSSKKKLSWPIRQKIALGTARGLAYLHYGAQPSIIHRDIKASNILLDEKFEAKVADFGLAKFNPEGMTHMSTRVAGTMGYVAPEYALYGQLTERSDVFSFGVLLLELLSGRKALETNEDGQPSAFSDLAWSLVRNNRALDVVEDGMPEPGTPEILEKYVLVAVLCSHPQLYARPTMDQVVKMLETDDEAVPSVVERPIPFIAGRLDIEKSASNNSGQLCSPTGYQAYTLQLQSRRASTCNEEEGNSKRPSNCEEEEGEEGNSKRPSNCKEEEGNSRRGSVSKD
ncbi:putative receptor protein kinase [Trifolium repens]|nr:putative receptor protein kinase [Trifolium repens]